MSDATTTLVFAIMSLLVLITGLVLAATPYFQRRGEVFAVMLPTEALDDPLIARLKKRYAVYAAVCSVVLFAACLVAAIEASVGVAVTVFILAILVELLVCYGIMLHFRREMLILKCERGWVVETDRGAAVVGEEDAIVPQGISLWWNLLYIPIIAVTAAIFAVSYESIPDMVPMHVGLDGEVNAWMPKGPGIFALPIGLEVFLAAVMTFCHYIMVVSKRWTDPGAPVTSAWAYGKYLRANTTLVVSMGLLLAAVLGIGIAFAEIGVLDLMEAVAIVLFITVILCVASAAVSVVYGQAGSRLLKRSEAVSGVAEDDEHWKLGMFYWNPDDASAVLPKRFGFGWTLNWARPVAWLWVGGILLASVAFAVFCAVVSA